MRKFNGYDEAKKAAQSQRKQLPPGAYVCRVMGVKYETAQQADWSDRVIIQFDISEGEQRDFFRKQYDTDSNEDKKWKGVMRLYVPKDDGSENDKITKKIFAGWTDNFEKSNPGYTWDWDEQKWKNLYVGIVFGKTGTVINGKNITFTEPRFSVEIAKVRDGSAPEAAFKAKNGWRDESQGSNDFMAVPDNVDEEIPF